MRKFIVDNAVSITSILGSLLFSALVGLVWLYQLATVRIPDLSGQIAEIKLIQEKSIEKTRDELSGKINQKTESQEKRLDKVETNITSIKVNLLGLMNKVGKLPNERQIRELMAAANEFGDDKSKIFSEAKLIKKNSNLPGPHPFSQWATSTGNDNLEINKDDVIQGTSDVKYVKALLSRSIASESAHWKVVGDRVAVYYKDGSIMYTPKDKMTPEELDKLVKELNETGDSFINSWMKPQKVE